MIFLLFFLCGHSFDLSFVQLWIDANLQHLRFVALKISSGYSCSYFSVLHDISTETIEYVLFEVLVE